MSNNKIIIKNESKKDKSGIKKYTHVEHVLKISDTYVGSMEKSEEEHWIYNQELNKMEKKRIKELMNGWI